MFPSAQPSVPKNAYVSLASHNRKTIAHICCLRALPAIDLPPTAHLRPIRRSSPKRNPRHVPTLTPARPRADRAHPVRPRADCAVIRALARPRARPVHPRVGRAVVRVLALAPSDRSQAARRVDWKTAARAGLPSIGILSRKTDRVRAPLPSYCLNQSRYVAHELLDPCHLPFVLVQGCAADGPLR